jgi:hypothetical protein
MDTIKTKLQLQVRVQSALFRQKLQKCHHPVDLRLSFASAVFKIASHLFLLRLNYFYRWLSPLLTVVVCRINYL